MICHEDGFCTEMIALFGTGYKHNVIGDAEGEFSVLIHQCSDGKVGQGEECPTLTHMATIEMFGRDGHLGNCVMSVDFDYLAASTSCKMVGLI